MFNSDEVCPGGGPERVKVTYIKPKSTAPTEDAFILLVCLSSGKFVILGEDEACSLAKQADFVSIHGLYILPPRYFSIMSCSYSSLRQESFSVTLQITSLQVHISNDCGVMHPGGKDEFAPTSLSTSFLPLFQPSVLQSSDDCAHPSPMK